MARFNVYAAISRTDTLDRIGTDVESSSPRAAITRAWGIVDPGERFLVMDLDREQGHAFKAVPRKDREGCKLKRVLAA